MLNLASEDGVWIQALPVLQLCFILQVSVLMVFQQPLMKNYTHGNSKDKKSKAEVVLR